MAESFSDTTKLVIKQNFEPIEAMANAAANALNLDALGALGETANKYDVYTNDGGHKFRVVESSDYLCRCCFRPNHALKLHVFEPMKSDSKEVLSLDRPCKCGRCFSCCGICRQEMTVEDNTTQDNAVIGHIMEPFLGGGLSPALNVMDREGGDPVATVQANAVCCIGGLCCDHTFVVKDTNSGATLGKIVKQRPEDLKQLATELASDADVFELEVNKNMKAKRKATLFAALHLIDYYLFESEGDSNIDLVNCKGTLKCCDMYCCGCVCPCSVSCGGGEEGEAGQGATE